MTSEVEALKTNEILRRRKLRIQQVREQSKDIAKKIRLRATAEKYRQIGNLDSSKAKVYLEKQNELVKKLECLHAKSLANVGASHKSAQEVATVDKEETVDLSKQRARVATAQLRRKKQEKLDERKRILDRRLQAREAANEISREKATSVASKLLNTPKKSEATEPTKATEIVPDDKTATEPKYGEPDVEVIKSDMATQWDCDAMPNEWEPNVPQLSLPKDDSPKESTSRQPETQRSKRTNLFAISDEMPSSLGGSRVSSMKASVIDRPSLTLVSDYLQRRDLRLREYDAVPSNRPNEDLQGIKQTIQRTRASRIEGNPLNPVHVADGQYVPVPCWKAEDHCSICTTHAPKCKKFQRLSKTCRSINPPSNQTLSSYRTAPPVFQPKPVLRGSSPFRRSKVCPGTFSAKSNPEKPSKVNTESDLSKKHSVTVYNHSTRDIRDVPYGDKKLVSRNESNDDDAYSHAMKESSKDNLSRESDHQKRLQEMRSKIAVTKQNVDKEYKDTMAFLRSLPKENSKPIRSAYKDDSQQQHHKELRQKKMQLEFRKIQKECRRHPRKTPKAPAQSKNESDEDFNAKDSQYSWMPVPESDGGLAIHIIPTKVKENKCGNAVRFSKIDSYHEYRSRHKHTPPTKDTCDMEKPKAVETDFSEASGNESSSEDSDSSSETQLRLKEAKSKKSRDHELSDAERIIIYKVLDADKSERRSKLLKKSSKTVSNIAKSLSFVNKEVQAVKVDDKVPASEGDEQTVTHEKHQKSATNKEAAEQSITKIIFEQVKNGLYKAVSEKGPHTSSADQPPEGIAKESADANKPPAPPTASTVSFKTAANEKILDAIAPNENFIPKVDYKGTESGKFYIGASGFLKDDAYEVVIQLRKSDKMEVINTSEQTKSEAQVKNVTQGTNQVDKEIPTEITSKVDDDTSAGTADKNVGTVDSDEKLQNDKLKTKLVNKSVETVFHEYVIAPSEVKPANSVSVQTTLDSTEMRPGHHRMSSSTSTAYMSPPESILPHFLRQGHQNESNFYYHPYREHKTCLNSEIDKPWIAKAMTNKKLTRPKSTISSLKRGKNMSTPPNTARSTQSGYSSNNHKCRAKKQASSSRAKNIHKCLKHLDSSAYFKIYTEKTRKPVPVAPVPSKVQKGASKKSSYAGEKHDLNPIIKWYVDKLLYMNKQGLNTLQVLNQDCSVVTTPCSSVVNDLNNIKNDERGLDARISLEQFKMSVAESIIKEYELRVQRQINEDSTGDIGRRGKAFSKFSLRFPKKRSIHKVKSLNISKSLLAKPKSAQYRNDVQYNRQSTRNSSSKEQSDSDNSVTSNRISRSQKSLIPHKSLTDKNPVPNSKDRIGAKYSEDNLAGNHKTKSKHNNYRSTSSKEVEVNSWDYNSQKTQPNIPITASTQTSRIIDEEINFIKLAEDKLQNMEKIADLTEKCTKRLTNLAKVLDEVRKNKLACNQISESPSDTDQALGDKYNKLMVELKKRKSVYSQISETPSDTDQTSEKNSETRTSSTYEPKIEIKQKPVSPQFTQTADTFQVLHKPLEQFEEDRSSSPIFTSVLKDIPKPKPSKSPTRQNQVRSPKGGKSTGEQLSNRSRSKPPPALNRKCLRRTPEIVQPHELSTVLEVDSPMSTKHKSQSVRHDSKNNAGDISEILSSKQTNNPIASTDESNNKNPDLLPPSQDSKFLSSEISDESKIQMMDLKQFNAIMLKPFISIQEYAKKCNITTIEEESIPGNVPAEDVLNDEISSMHSDGSLPDVIAELLKRNIISEPFKFDTKSNVNTTSSDSTLSVLALSKMKKGRNDTNKISSNKENLGESSDSLSISSNPDLEKAFKQLGMGWASSTLKKTKEHLALSSSSTSSTSLSQFKTKPLNNNNNNDFPALITDSMCSIRNTSHAPGKRRTSNDAKNAVQQTSKATAMTVKQFLTDELAKRITFGEKPDANNTEEFVSLYQTQFPDNAENSRKANCEERSFDSTQRPRTSTPVQLFRSANYHSSSGSNVSNGLFSNADELSSVKGTSNSFRNNSTSEKDDLAVPNCSLRTLGRKS